jgi:hypothetical protein
MPGSGTGKVAVGRRFADPNIELESLSSLGGLYLMTGRVDEGLALLDESMAALCAGEMTEIATVDSLLAAMPGNQEAMDGFARVNAGVTSPSDFFSPQNVEWIMSRAGAATAVH